MFDKLILGKEYVMEKKLLCPKDVEEIYSISIRTLANWRSLGKGPGYVKLGGKVLYPVYELQKWIRKCKVYTIDSIDDKDLVRNGPKRK